MSLPIRDELLGPLSAFATETFGLRFPPDRWVELARGVAGAALELGRADLDGWAERLVAGGALPDEVAALANHLTVSETYFFRQREAFTALETEILPERIAVRRLQAGLLRIWSAGCASGEEAYSVAILLRHAFPELRPERVAIAATDVASSVLARAERGRYSEWSFRDAPDWLKPGYFRTRSPGRYEVVPEIRQMVSFQRLNLAAPAYPAEFGERGDFDAILCRNVLMYFSAEWQDRIIRRFAHALAPGGWLLVGPCDVTADQALDLRLQSPRPGVFHKTPAAKVPARVTLQTADNPASEPPQSPRPHPAPVAGPRAGRRPAGSRDRAAGHSPAPSLPPPPPEALARAHADRGELDAALAACDEALAKDSLAADIHHLRACVLMELNRWSEAEAGFRRLLYLAPDSVMAHFSLGSLAQRAGRADEARHHFNQVLGALASHPHGEPVPQGEGLTVGRLREVVERSLEGSAA